MKDKIFEIGGTTYETRSGGGGGGGGGHHGGNGGGGGGGRDHSHGRGHGSTNNIATTSSLSRSNMIESFAYSPSDGKLVYSGRLTLGPDYFLMCHKLF